MAKKNKSHLANLYTIDIKQPFANQSTNNNKTQKYSSQWINKCNECDKRMNESKVSPQ